MEENSLENAEKTSTSSANLELVDKESQPSTSGGVMYTEPHNEKDRTADLQAKAASSNPFHVDTSPISAVPVNEQASELQELGLRVFNQDEFEEGTFLCVLYL